MNCNKKMKKFTAMFAVLVMLLTAFAVVAETEDADASVAIDQTGVSVSGFKQDKTGTLHVPVNCTEASDTVTIKVSENGNEIATQTFEVVNGIQTLDISFKLHRGDHVLDIQSTDSNGDSTYATTGTFHVSKNVWSNVTTYLAIALIAIIIIIIAAVYIRANPRNKPTTTFTELEKQKNEAKKEAELTKTSKKEYDTGTKKTDKIKYTSSRRK